MTRIDFYRYADDKLHFACRLAGKAYESGSQVVVYTPDRGLLEAFDRQLWGYQATRFVPHCFADSPLAPQTPVLLATQDTASLHHDVLLNLGDAWPPFFASFERLLEVVSTDDADKQRARERYRFYQQRGYDIQVNTIEGERPQATA